jgi:hypothetical protein
MRTWLRPLPCEGIIAAVLGASLGVILANESAFLADSWTNLPRLVAFIGIVVIFGLSVHFACTAVQKRAKRICYFFIFVCLFNGAVLNVWRLKEWSVDPAGRITLLPDNVALSVTALFAAWLITQLIIAGAATIWDND